MVLVVKVEVWPHGDESKKRELGKAVIANNGTGDKDTGNYDVRLYKWGEGGRVWKRGTVTGFARLLRGPWDLLHLALVNTLSKRTT